MTQRNQRRRTREEDDGANKEPTPLAGGIALNVTSCFYLFYQNRAIWSTIQQNE